MARFYAEMSTERGTRVSRCAHRRATAHLRGWNIGAETSVDASGEEDVVQVCITGGSNGSRMLLDLGTFKLVDGKLVQVKDGELIERAS